MTPYDALIIGAGHNGLVTAAYLARAGLRVLALERRPVVGGSCVTEEVWPGYRVSTAAYLCGLLQPRIINDLDLGYFGYEILPKDPAFFSPFPDGRRLFIWRDDHQTAEEIAQFSQADALRLLTQSARDFLDAWFDSPELKAALATDGVIGARGGPSTPGTAYVLFHHCMGVAAGKAGLWGFVRGGMGAISEALAAAARSHGAEVRTGVEVAEVLVREGRARGVVLTGGEEITARVVISNADPKRTFLRLVPARHLDPEFRREGEAIRMAGVAMKVNLALDGLPDFPAAPGTAPGPQHRGTIHVGPSMDYIDRAWDDARAGRPSREPFLEVTIPTTYDPALAPPGKHIMSIFVQYAPFDLAAGTWDQLKESYADRVIETLSAYAPNLPQIIRQRHVLSPLDLERDFGLTGGDIFHGEMTPDRLFFLRPVPGWAQYRTPIAGLYLCGSGTHPGGGVLGAPGYNAAREILRDWRRGTAGKR